MGTHEFDDRQLDKLVIETYPDHEFDEADGEWVVLFNPSDYSLTRANRYDSPPTQGTSRPATAFAHGLPDQLSVTFLLDGTGVIGDPGPVTERVKEFLGLMRFRGEDHRPAYLRVRWGPLDLPCVLKTATAAFVLFDRAGEPLRARISASFEEVMGEQERVNRERASSPDLYQSWTVEEGQSIDAIAQQVYGDTRYWRPLAEVNGLENPRELPSGLELILPPLER